MTLGLALGTCWVLAATSFASDSLSFGGMLTADDAGTGDLFGTSVSVSGVHGIVGAPGQSELGPKAGAVYAFRRSGSSWTLMQKIHPPTPVANGVFGTDVAVDGNRMLVGAPGANGSGIDTGAAYLYVHDGSQWVFARHLVVNGLAAGDQFGSAVALQGNEFFVSAVRQATAGSRSGVVYAFDVNGLKSKLVGSATGANESFGWSLEVDGDHVVVGAPGHDSQGDWSGAAYVFSRRGSAWTEEALLRASDGGTSAFFGSAVEIEGDRIAIGAHGESTEFFGSGAVYVYTSGISGWRLDEKLKAVKPIQGAQFGRSLHLFGDTLAVGARTDPTMYANAGRVFVLRHRGLSWQHQSAIDEPTAGFNHWFGADLDGDFGQLLVGAPHSALNAMDAGAVHALSLQTGFGYCWGDETTTQVCPCGNLSDGEGGCQNSMGRGAMLYGAGSNQLHSNDLEFFVHGLRPGASALLVAGDSDMPGAMQFFGDGLSCIGGGLRSLGTRQATPAGMAYWRNPVPSGSPWQAGRTVYLQVLYRDTGASPCGSSANTSNAYELTLVQ